MAGCSSAGAPTPCYSEFAADGSLVMDAVMPLGPSVVPCLHAALGRPSDRAPATAAIAGSGGATVYASWNGATSGGVAGAVLAGKQSRPWPTQARRARTGFETAIGVENEGPYFAVEPRDSSGHTLARSATVPLVS